MLVVPASASADDEERVSLRYEASGACPSEAEFVSLVRVYTTNWKRVSAETVANRTMRVVISEGASRTNGRLVVANARGVVAERDITGPSCVAVSHALAIMVAVAIDPQADIASADEGRAREGPPAATPSTKRPHESAARARPAPSSGRAPMHQSVRVSLDVRAETTSAVVRGALLGIGASMKLELGDEVGPTWLRALKPNVGIGLRQSFAKELALRGGSTDFTWTAGNARLCPLRLAMARIAAVSPCGEINVGRLSAAAEGFSDARSASTFWYDLGGSLWGTVSVSNHVFVSSTLLVTAPMTRKPFALTSGAIISDPPAVGVLGGIGIGVTM